MIPLMIVADTYKLAHLYAREHDLGPEGRRWKYISSPIQVRGYRGGRYVNIRSADAALSQRGITDRVHAVDALKMAGFTHVEDE